MDIHGIANRIKGALSRGNDVTGNAADNGPRKPAVNENDSLNLSTISRILNQDPLVDLPEWGTSFKTIPPIPHTMRELQDALDAYINGVRERISQIFDSAGIQLEEDVQIQADDNGFSISAASQQLDSVINTLNQDPQLSAQLNHLQQRHQLTGLLNAASALGKDEDSNGDTFRALHAQQSPLTLVIAANDSGATQITPTNNS